MRVTFAELIAASKNGGVVSFPTDTVPALAVSPDRADLIFALKNRSFDKPLILMAASLTDLQSYIAGTTEARAIWQQVAQKFWPGALTLVLPASPSVPPGVNPGDRATIGIRVPDLALARDILAATGPLATTSANRSGELPLKTMGAIAAAFPEVGVFHGPEVDPEAELGSGLPSTVAKWTGDGWAILRQGSIILEEATA